MKRFFYALLLAGILNIYNFSFEAEAKPLWAGEAWGRCVAKCPICVIGCSVGWLLA